MVARKLRRENHFGNNFSGLLTQLTRSVCLTIAESIQRDKQILWRKKSMPFAKTKKTVAGLLTGLLAYTPSALSQEGAVEEIEEVVVTGTRLKTTNENSSQPIVSLGEDALAKSGEFDIGEVLNDTPALLNSVTSTNSVDSSAVNIGQTQNFGGAALDLRGLGIKRTLT